MIRAILFDVQGVLTHKAYRPNRKRCLKLDERLNLAPGSVTSAIASFKREPAALSGLLAALDLRRPSPGDLDPATSSGSRLNEANIALVSALQGRYRLGVLANSDGTVEKRLQRHGVRDLFDDVVDSALVGLRKPDERIYVLAAARLHLSPSDCLFIDDKQANVDGAIAAGMRAARYVEGGVELAALMQRFGVSLDGDASPR